MNIWEFFRNFAPNMTKNSTYLASKPRYEILDGLRGVAAMLVVFADDYCAVVHALDGTWHRR